MSDRCVQIAPLLFRVAEAEASPDEAMRTARHLSDCTACRILLARERRLAAMLEEGLDDPLQVGEDFVDSVMANLPQGPPPARRKRRGRLKLASLAGLIAALLPALRGADSVALAWGSPWRWLPALDVPLADGLADGALRLGGMLVLVLDRLVAGQAFSGDGFAGAIAVLVLPPVILAVLASASVLAVAMRGLLRVQ